MKRRDFLKSSSAFGIFAVMPPAFAAVQNGVELPTSDQGWRKLTEDQWRQLLSESEFAILREEATERPYTSPLNDEKREGMFHCAGCDLAVYPSDTKYDSKTGWPSFWAPVSADVIGTKPDNSLFATRTEVHCARCGGHFGHIFDDGPDPTGERHCLNGIALSFKPAAESEATQS
jgi:peptide-methionine (R)-S-oxide reductase